MTVAPAPAPLADGDRRERLRVRRLREERLVDWTLLLGALAVVLASVLMTPGADGVSLFGWDLPGLCTFRNLTGLRCPGCGMTRSFVYMGHLDPLAAFRLHVIGPPLYLLVAVQVPWRAWKRWGARAAASTAPRAQG